MSTSPVSPFPLEPLEPAAEGGREASEPRVVDVEAQLIARVAANDLEAFDRLYAQFVRPILAMARRSLGNDGSAEEVAQEAFASIWRSAGSYSPERGSATAWIYAIARNAIFDALRRRRVRAEHPPAEVMSDGGDPSHESAEAAWIAWRVHAALEKLPERERLVLELAYWRGLSQVEIAEQLAVPLGTVKSRTRIALGRMATMLEGVKEEAV